MPELKEYEITINGLPHTVQLSPEDAKRAGKEAVVIDRLAMAQAELDRQAEEALVAHVVPSDGEPDSEFVDGTLRKRAGAQNKAATAGASK